MPPLKTTLSSTRLKRCSIESLVPNSNNNNSGSDRHFVNKTYCSKVLNNLNSFRADSKFCDVEIVTGDHVVKAHKAVLSASSPYFQAMFSTGLSEEHKNRIELHGNISPTILETLVHFIYSGEISLNEDNVQDVMIVGDMFELKDVVLACTEYMKQELSTCNAIGIYRFAEGHNFLELTSAAVQFIQLNFPRVFQEDECVELPKDQLCNFLASEFLKVDSEYQVFQAALRWICHDLSQRRCFVFEILNHVRLPLVCLRLIENNVKECTDASLKVALRSIRKDLITRKGSLVTLYVQPRLWAKKDIYVIGGSKRESVITSWTRAESFESTYQTVERFDTFRRKWFHATPMEAGRILPGVATLNNRIFVVGGEQESQILADGECYDPSELTWSRIAAMNVPRCEFGLTGLDGYDPVLDEWNLESCLSEPRFSMGVVSYGGLIYLVGGFTRHRRHSKDLVAWSPASCQWENRAPMLTPRSQMGVAVLDGFLYVLGGTNRTHEVLRSVERYCFETNTWTEIAPMRVGRASPAVAAADGRLYVIGGDQTLAENFYRAQNTIDHVERFSPLTGTWEDCEPLPESRSEAGAVVL
ncbi:hypothetical protein M8J76_011299 [Diaphorina citri]|nr:hypothetical protein M8J76_011299 [Diaphorina citri]